MSSDGLPIQVGRVKGYECDVKVLRDTGCTTTVVRKSLCDKRDFTGEQQACLLMDGTLIVKPVVVTQVDTPFYTGQVRAVAMEHPVCDVIIGNIQGARNSDDPDPDWTPGKCEVTKVNRKLPGKVHSLFSSATSGRTQKMIPSLRELRDANKGEKSEASNLGVKVRTANTEGRKGKQVELPERQTQVRGEVRHGSKSLTHEVLGETQVTRGTRVKPGDKVLVLTPTGTRKNTRWTGPCEVIKQVHGNCYIVNFYGKKRIYHVSMLVKCLDKASVGPSVAQLGRSAVSSREN